MSDASGASGEVELVQLLTPEGRAGNIPCTLQRRRRSDQEFYHDMVWTAGRPEGERLQRTGRTRTGASCLGQEAARSVREARSVSRN